MNCINCSSPETKVIDKRDSDNHQIKRRRECLNCSKRFTTFERAEIIPIQVLKKDGSTEIFNSEKLIKGLSKACQKRMNYESIKDIAIQVEQKCYDPKPLTSKRIGEEALKILKKTDPSSYLRFASVYKDFESLQAFKEEIIQFNKKR